MYRQTTNDITIEVRSVFLEDQSSAAENRFVWAYQVTIRNGGEKTVQLLNRYWRITDAQGHVQEVRGAGVVGEQPVIHPGDSYEYTSGTPLTTPSGIMVGAYEMMDEDGDHFEAAVPAFSLDSPHDRAAVN
ncbi:ApaG protein [Caenispirillum salinarum AK4]|uniref:Protein ApaG n=1 Tax=Caenispirillum salinarum AK4 TaxID=1238182 RepID=K9HP45_9PROT|nr:Co2+/Mg2+ efflux protein ApaG [Caenispirillum salinarum]EKV32063.1 ApaG protein [Caenispirillum salinarum AK4]